MSAGAGAGDGRLGVLDRVTRIPCFRIATEDATLGAALEEHIGANTGTV